MEQIIVIIWFLLVLAIPLAFLVTSYSRYISGEKVSELLGKLLVSLIVYISLTVILLPFMFLVIFAGAHTKPVGEVLNLREELFYWVIVLIYALTGWLLCSLINGRIIKPWVSFS